MINTLRFITVTPRPLTTDPWPLSSRMSQTWRVFLLNLRRPNFISFMLHARTHGRTNDGPVSNGLRNCPLCCYATTTLTFPVSSCVLYRYQVWRGFILIVGSILKFGEIKNILIFFFLNLCYRDFLLTYVYCSWSLDYIAHRFIDSNLLESPRNILVSTGMLTNYPQWTKFGQSRRYNIAGRWK